MGSYASTGGKVPLSNVVVIRISEVSVSRKGSRAKFVQYSSKRLRSSTSCLNLVWYIIRKRFSSHADRRVLTVKIEHSRTRFVAGDRELSSICRKANRKSGSLVTSYRVVL